MTKTFRLLLALAFLLPFFATAPARAQLYNAGDPCPEPTAGRLFTQEGAAGPSLVCNGTTLEVDESVKTGPYARGVGTANPKAPLHVAGEAIIGPTTGLVCDADRAGGIRYNSGGTIMEYCNGTAWASIGGGKWLDGVDAGDIYYSGGPVGIGTNNPSADLHISSSAPDIILDSSVAGAGRISFRESGVEKARISGDGTAGGLSFLSSDGAHVALSVDAMRGDYRFGVPNNSTRNLRFRNMAGGWDAANIKVTKSSGGNNNGTMEIKTTGHAIPQLFLDTVGNVGVGSAAPKAPLHVAGEAIIGPTTGLACDADRKGGLRWSDAESTIEMCDGTDWKQVAAATCDNAPAFPSFTTQNNLATSSLTTSNIALITGMDAGCTAGVSVSGTGGSPEYRTCSDAACSSEVQTWTAANNTLDIQGDYIQLRATSSASQATAFVITANIGPVSSTWTISTGVTGCAPEGTVCADGTVYAGLSGAGTPMYVTRCDAGMTWDGSACTGTRGAYYWNNGNGTGYVDTTVSNSGTTDGKGYTAVLITEDSDSAVGGVQPHQAAQYCADLVMHGYDDWYLPARNELHTMVLNKTAIGNFDVSGTYYWSSSEYGTNYAWSERPSDGNQKYSNPKYDGYAIRCARR